LPVTILTADNYFNDISELIKEYGNFDLLRDSGYDVDSPENFYLDLLREDILKLQKGINVLIPEYLVNGTGISKPNSIPIKSNKIIIVEGMCSIYDKIKDVFDIKIYIDLDEEERKRRFLNRAVSRNQDSENAIKHWKYIQTAGKKYLQPHKNECEIIINGECDLDYFAHMVEYINLITNNFTE
jgi:uridine kinase